MLIESDCISAGDASVSPVNPVSTSNGVASAVYKAGPGCVGEDQISATLLFGSDKTSEVAMDVVTVSQAGKEKTLPKNPGQAFGAGPDGRLATGRNSSRGQPHQEAPFHGG